MFRTIEECRCELVAHTVMKGEPIEFGDPVEGTWGQAFLTEGVDASFLPVSAARASFGNEDKTGQDKKADLKLMKFIADHNHVTPFEYNHATFLIEAPLFVLSQIKTHRTLKALDLATNVISRRYTSEDIQFWIPDNEYEDHKWRKQSTSNKQCSTSEVASYSGFCIPGATEFSYRMMMENLKYMYEEMLEHGVCREQARAVLPESLITRFYLGGTLRNWAGFIELRDSDNAQEETRTVAKRICSQLKELWPDATNYLLGEN